MDIGNRKQEMMELRLDGWTYQQIGDKYSISRQRVQQLVSPPVAIRNLVVKRAGGKCQECGILVGANGHVHHDNGDGEDYNDIEKLRLLCIGCHRRIHWKGFEAPPFNRNCSECGTKMMKSGRAHTGKGENIRYYQAYKCNTCGRRAMNWHEPKPKY